MDLCSIFAILPMVCNDPEPEPVEEEAPAANELVIEAQPAPTVAASSIEPSQGPALPSLTSYLSDDLDAPAAVEEPVADEPMADEPEVEVAAAPRPVNPALSLRPQEVEQIPQAPDMANVDLPGNVEGDVTTVATTSGAEVVAIRPDNPDEAAVFVMPARIENVPADAPELEGPFDNPTDIEEYLSQPRHRRSHQVERLDIDS